MSNIFEIQASLQGLINEIEENEGVVTEELEQALEIKQEEFVEKVKSYASVITNLENDLLAIKAEQDRLKSLKERKEKTIERLENILGKAIRLWGTEAKTKSENKSYFVEWATGKVSVKNSEIIELNDNYCETLMSGLMKPFVFNNYTNTDAPSTGVIVASMTESVSNFNVDELPLLRGDLKVNLNIEELIKSDEGRKVLFDLIKYTPNITLTPKISKVDVKKYITTCGETNLGTLNIKDKVTIK